MQKKPKQSSKSAKLAGVSNKMEVPTVPIEGTDPHALADAESWLNRVMHDELVLSVEGVPTTRTQAIFGADGLEYDTHPVYPLLVDHSSRKTKRSTGRVLGYEYRFSGLEVDIADGTEGSYLSYPMSRIVRMSILQAAS